MTIKGSSTFKKKIKALRKTNNNVFNGLIEIMYLLELDLITEKELPRNHNLKFKMEGLKSFALNEDFRVIYKVIGNNEIKLYDLGTHDEVYY